MSKTLNVALIQHRDCGTPDANLSFIEKNVASAASGGAKLVLLQELHNGAYFCQHQHVDEFDRAESIPGPSTERLAKCAKQHGVVLVSSLFERRAAGLYHNTSVVFENDGRVLGQYRKMHIPDDPGFMEKFYFTPGDADPGFQPIQTSVGKLGVLICWDQWYPEAARLMALAGAELLLYPTAIGWDPNDSQAEKDRQRMAWILSHRGHAVANGIPVLSCNRTGFEAPPDTAQGGASGIQFWGSSIVLGPQGEILAEASTDQEQVLHASIDMARSEDVRRIWPFLRDRRIDAYSDLLKRFRS
jgi:N-carbamoylputrescine amidase